MTLLATAYFLIVGAGQVAGLISRAELNQRLDRVERRIIASQGSAEALQLSLLNERSGILGFVLSGDRQFLESYHKGRLEEGEASEMLRRSLRASPDLVGHLEVLTPAIEDWHSQIVVPALDAMQQGRRAEAIVMLTERGPALFDPVRDGSNRLARAIGDKVAQDRRQVDQAEAQLAGLMLAASTTGFVLSAMTVWLLRTWVTQPISWLSAKVRRVAEGNLDHVITPSGPPELAGLALDVEAMRLRILGELENAVRAVEGLKQDAPLVHGLRSDLAGGTGPTPPGLSVATRFLPAKGVLAGDWYDLIELREGKTALAVIDVSGHGPVAGLFALKIKQFLVPALRLGMSPGDALRWVSDQLGDTGDQFATCLVVEISPSSGYCRYANAGHPPGLVVGANIEELGPSGPLLGPFPATWATKATRLDAGDLLVVHTDGLIEARNPEGREFGMERMVDLVTGRSAQGPEAVADELLVAVRRFSGARLVDDLTLVVTSLDVDPPISSEPPSRMSGQRSLTR